MAAHQTNDRDLLIVSKYLLEALSKERQLETALQAQILLARRPGLERALRDHLVVTRRQITAIEDRLREIGQHETSIPGLAAAEAVVELVGSVANKGLALAKGPLQALRGSSFADKELRAARDCYWNEAEEIAHYRVIETVAEQVGDHETAELARTHRAEEEQMQHTLEGLLAPIVREVVETESPDPERDARPEPTRPAAAKTAGAAGSRRRGSHATTTNGRAKPTSSAAPASTRAKTTARRTTATAANAARKPTPATNRPA